MRRGTSLSTGSFAAVSCFSILLVLLAVPPAARAGGEPPRVLAAWPADGSDRVPADAGAILVVFDRDMDRESHSLVGAEGGETPPVTGGVRWLGPRAVSIAVGALPAGRRFALGLNGEKHHGFRNADGVPLPPFVLRFASAPAGAAARPVVARVEPAPGAVGVDPGLDEIVVTFAEDVKPGGMSLLRLPGAEVLGYVRERPPYLRSPRVLAIPVRLRPGVTYGASVNGTEKAGFVAAATGEPFLPHPIVFTTAAAGAPPPDADDGLSGRWSATESGVRIAIALGADGRYLYEAAFDGETETARGAWRRDGSTLVFSEDGAAEPLRVPFRRPDAATLEVELDGTTVRLVREGDAAPAARRLDGVWEWSDGARALRITLRADGSYEYRSRMEGGEATVRGRWRDLGEAIEIVPEGRDPIRLACRLVDADMLEISLGAGDPVRLARSKTVVPPASPPKPSLAGTWAWCGEGAEVRIVLGADGRFAYRGREGDEVEETRGTWRDLGASLEIREDGAAEPLVVPYRLAGGRLEIELDGTRIPLERQE